MLETAAFLASKVLQAKSPPHAINDWIGLIFSIVSHRDQAQDDTYCS